MPPLLCPSPALIDQSFPRDSLELFEVASALGEMQELFDNKEIGILLTSVLEEIVDSQNWDWSRVECLPVLTEIYKYLMQLFLQGSSGIVRICVEKVTDYFEHPIPCGCANNGLISIWADELGRLLKFHDTNYQDSNFHFGIACHLAFSGKPSGSYSSSDRAFPMLGRDCTSQLDDAYKWILPHDIGSRSVTFAQAKANCSVLGASRVAPPRGGSHFKVHFPGQRPWILDRNTDPIPERFLRELELITQYPLDVIRYVLTEGSLPEYKLPWRRAFST
jgi:hypothetical protein